MAKSALKSGSTVIDLASSMGRRAAGSAGSVVRATPSSVMAKSAKLSAGAAQLAKKGASAAAGAATSGAKLAKKGTLAAADACKKNPLLCAAGVATIGTSLYTAKKYGDMKEDQKDCIQLCYPEDWSEYVEGKIPQPNYKVMDGVSRKDPALKYAHLFPEMEDKVCNLENLKKQSIIEGKESCDKFCEKACEIDATDVIANVVKDGASAVGKVGGAAVEGAAEGLGLDSIFEKIKVNWTYIAYGFVILLILIFLGIIASYTF
jgi:hypothetical protein